MAVLQPLNGGKIIPIDRAVILIGRGQECDVVIAGSRKISRKHCCLIQADDRYLIRDLGSMNGVHVNGKRIEREAEMAPGDQVSIGDVEFRFNPNARAAGKLNAPATEIPRVALRVATPLDVDSDEVMDALEIMDDDDIEVLDEVQIVEDLELIEDVEVLDDSGELSAIPGGTTPPTDQPLSRRRPSESEPIINLYDSFADDDIEDIVTFDDE